jgi:hypothetical protein
LFLNNATDTPQGRTFLGTVDITTDAHGNLATVTGGGKVSGSVATVTLTAPSGVTASAGQLLTSTATLTKEASSNAILGDTSEFSAAVVLTAK